MCKSNPIPPSNPDLLALRRIADQARRPDGGFVALLPWSLLHHIVGAFPRLAEKGLDIMVLALMNDREELGCFYGSRADEVAAEHDKLEDCLRLLETVLELGREAASRLENVYGFCKAD